jgi:hypothetical protein
VGRSFGGPSLGCKTAEAACKLQSQQDQPAPAVVVVGRRSLPEGEGRHIADPEVRLGVPDDTLAHDQNGIGLSSLCIVEYSTCRKRKELGRLGTNIGLIRWLLAIGLLSILLLGLSVLLLGLSI